MKHKLIKGFLILGICGMSYSATYAETMNLNYDGLNHQYTSPSIQLYVNGNSVTTSVPPVQMSDDVLVPAREVFSVAGAEVEWRPSEQSIYVHNESNLIVLKINSNEAWVNGQMKPLNIPAKLINNKVMIPIRFISEALGYGVNWSPSDYAIYVSTTGETMNLNGNQVTEVNEVLNGIDETNQQSIIPDAGIGQNTSYIEPIPTAQATQTLEPINQSGTDGWLNSPYIHYVGESETLLLNGLEGLSAQQITIEEHAKNKQIVIHLNKDYSAYLQAGTWSKQAGAITKLQVVHQTGETQMILNTSTIKTVTASDENGGVSLKVVRPSDQYHKIVVIDAGHGANDPGACYAGVQEKDITLKVAQALVSRIEQDPDIKVYATREDDTFLELTERTDFSNQINPDLFISVHVNSAGSTAASGTETYYTAKADTRNKTFAAMVQQALVNEFGTKSRGVKTNTFVVTKKTNSPAILIEIGFITNASDRAMMLSSDFASRYAEAVYQCILEYYAQGLNQNQS